MKKRRDPSSHLEHEVIWSVVILYAGLCTVILAIHFLQPDRAPAAAPGPAAPVTTTPAVASRP